VVPEPPGGAHQDPERAAALLDAAITHHLGELSTLSPDGLAEDRYRRFRALGAFRE